MEGFIPEIVIFAFNNLSKTKGSKNKLIPGRYFIRDSLSLGLYSVIETELKKLFPEGTRSSVAQTL